MEEAALTNLRAALEEYAQYLEANYKSELESKGHRATGKLIDTMSVHITLQGINYHVELNLQDYWWYVEHGRKPGKFPPVNKILEWIRIKPVIPRADSRGRIPTQQQLAFLISRKIARDGIPAENTLAELTGRNSAWKSKFEQALQMDFNIEAEKILKTILK